MVHWNLFIFAWNAACRSNSFWDRSCFGHSEHWTGNGDGTVGCVFPTTGDFSVPGGNLFCVFVSSGRDADFWWVLICFRRFVLRENVFWHTVQENGRTPVCEIECLRRSERRLNRLLHWTQTNGFSASCMCRMCAITTTRSAPRKGQKLHTCGIFKSWLVFSCAVNCCRSTNADSQNWQNKMCGKFSIPFPFFGFVAFFSVFSGFGLRSFSGGLTGSGAIGCSTICSLVSSSSELE